MPGVVERVVFLLSGYVSDRAYYISSSADIQHHFLATATVASTLLRHIVYQKNFSLTNIAFANIIYVDVSIALVYKFMEAEQHDWIYKCKRSGGALGHYNKTSTEALRRWSD